MVENVLEINVVINYQLVKHQMLIEEIVMKQEMLKAQINV